MPVVCVLHDRGFYNIEQLFLTMLSMFGRMAFLQGLVTKTVQSSLCPSWLPLPNRFYLFAFYHHDFGSPY
jgi:hypothetical protein